MMASCRILHLTSREPTSQEPANAVDEGGAFANPARVPAGNSNSCSNRRSWNVRKKRLDPLRERFARKPCWLHRFVPFRARLRRCRN
jgi:hypothetical protein